MGRSDWSLDNISCSKRVSVKVLDTHCVKVPEESQLLLVQKYFIFLSVVKFPILDLHIFYHDQ